MGIETRADLIQAFINKRQELIIEQKRVESLRLESINLERVILADSELMDKINGGGVGGAWGDMVVCSGGALFVAKIVNTSDLEDQLSDDQLKSVNDDTEND